LKAEAGALCARVRDYEKRLRLLEEGERDLSRDRELLRQEQLTHQKNVRQFDEELVERRAALAAGAAGHGDLEQERERLAKWQEELTRRGQELQVEHQRIQHMH